MFHLPFAYVGPGAGFAFLGSFFSILLSLLAGIASLLLWPFRALADLFRGGARARVVVLGVDSLDPNAVETLMTEGKVPSLQKLCSEGSYRRLRAEPAGGWATGAFWKTLAEHAVDSTVLLVAGVIPPRGFKGRRLWRTEGGQLMSQPVYYAKYLARLLGPQADSTDRLFFSALDHQKYGLLACAIDVAPEELNRIAGRLAAYSDKNTAVFIVSGRGALFSNRRLDANVDAMEDVSPAILRVFGFA